MMRDSWRYIGAAIMISAIACIIALLWLYTVMGNLWGWM